MVGPSEGSGIFVVLADVAHELAGEVVDRGEDAAGNDVALDFGEPQFNLIEPRRIGRGEVQMELGLSLIHI